MSNAIVMGWNRPVPGREKQAMELFQSSMAYWQKKKDAGVIESFEAVLMSAHGGDFNGFFLVKGEPEKLDAMSHEKDYVDLLTQIGIALDGFGAIRSFHGNPLMELMQTWGKHIQQY